MATIRCAACGHPAQVVTQLLGGYVTARCLTDGTFTSIGLPDHGASRSTDPDTSKAAGASVDPRGQHLALLTALERLGTGTRDEIAAEAGLTAYQASRRLSELATSELIEDTGTVRAGESGRMQTVYRVTPAGREERTAGYAPGEYTEAYGR